MNGGPVAKTASRSARSATPAPAQSADGPERGRSLDVVDDRFDPSSWTKMARTAASLGMTAVSFADWLEQQALSGPAAAPLTARERELIASSSGLDADELADAERRVAASWRPDAAAQRLSLVSASMTTKEAADRLGIGESAVRHRIRSGKLWATSVGGAHRIPSWQLTEGAETVQVRRAGSDAWVVHRVSMSLLAMLGTGSQHHAVKLTTVADDGTESLAAELRLPTGRDSTLPGIEEVVAAIPVDASPGSVHAFMTTPQDDLLADGVPTKPVEWLSDGRDPDAVAALLERLTTVW